MTPTPNWRTALDSLSAVARPSALASLLGVTARTLQRWRGGPELASRQIHAPTPDLQARLVWLAGLSAGELAAELGKCSDSAALEKSEPE